MKWVTREKVKVDRVACPWLIRKFIDPQAEFLFVPTEQVMDVAKREGATPYDVKGVEFGHHGKECSFDALAKKHGLTSDPAIVLLAKIVNGADTDNSLWNQPEGVSVDSAFYVVQTWWDGLTRATQSDPARRGLDELAQAAFGLAQRCLLSVAWSRAR